MTANSPFFEFLELPLKESDLIAGLNLTFHRTNSKKSKIYRMINLKVMLMYSEILIRTNLLPNRRSFQLQSVVNSEMPFFIK